MRLSPTESGWVGTFEAMASPCEVHIATKHRDVASHMAHAAAREAFRIEAKFSRYRHDNIVSEINSAEGREIVVDDETADLLDYAAILFDLSRGRFDITSGVLRHAWRFDGSNNVPSRQQVRAQLRKVGWQRVRWDRPRLKLEPGMEIDFGGIGKEYAVDRAGSKLTRYSAGSMINFGGDLLVLGPQRDGLPWRIGVESCRTPDQPAMMIELARGALATSGDTRRFLIRNGRRYSHVLDPTTGWPVRAAPRSVTVLADSCTLAGMFATFALLEGKRAEDFLAGQQVRYWCNW